MHDDNILIWLPSPMGDAILATPAMRAIRRHFQSSKITFLANTVIQKALAPCPFNDDWLVSESQNPFAIAKLLKACNFRLAILLKNSFLPALATALVRIQTRIGYARHGRRLLLTDPLFPEKLPTGEFKPVSMIDYYLAISKWLGCETNDRKLELSINPEDSKNLLNKLPQITEAKSPIIILVPGGAFGPSKCWPSERFARIADLVAADYNATVIVSVSPAPAEHKIALQICDSSRNNLINLAQNPLTIGQLKALFAKADLVIANDTGPRHIAIALNRKVITLFGPNDPAWTDTGFPDEIKIVSDVDCAPCQKPNCKKTEHLCMEAITVEMVYTAAKQLLRNQIYD